MPHKVGKLPKTNFGGEGEPALKMEFKNEVMEKISRVYNELVL